MSIKSRLPQIKEQASANLMNGICLRSKNYVVIAMRSLTNNAMNYEFRMEYTGKEKFQDVEYQVVECKYCQDALCEKCKGAEKTTCRHFLAAFLWANERKGYKVNFFDNFSDAFRYSNFGGRLVKLVSNGHSAWAVVSQDEAPGDGGVKASDFDSGPTTEYQRMLKQELDRRENMKKRVDMMRGPVERGIE